jgi:hypothetical protein
MAVEGTNPGLYRMGGMYGSAWRDGVQLAEAVEVTANVEVNRIEIPIVGQTRQGYKPGREAREGTMRVQKIDSAWQLELWNFLSMNLQTRRALRGTAQGALRPFQLQIEIDDPDALDTEKWQLDGVLIWRMSIGFSITDDIMDTELPITWESEKPLSAFVRTGGLDPATGLPAIRRVYSVT